MALGHNLGPRPFFISMSNDHRAGNCANRDLMLVEGTLTGTGKMPGGMPATDLFPGVCEKSVPYQGNSGEATQNANEGGAVGERPTGGDEGAGRSPACEDEGAGRSPAPKLAEKVEAAKEEVESRKQDLEDLQNAVRVQKANRRHEQLLDAARGNNGKSRNSGRFYKDKRQRCREKHQHHFYRRLSRDIDDAQSNLDKARKELTLAIYDQLISSAINCMLTHKLLLPFLEILIKEGFSLYLVGGALRDTVEHVVGKQILSIKDLDFAISHPRVADMPIETGLKVLDHMLNSLATPGMVRRENNTFVVKPPRSEEAYEFSVLRTPDEKQITRSIEQDVCRRDTTVNALYLELVFDNGDWCGTIHDPTQCGLDDCVAKTVRTISSVMNGSSYDQLKNDPTQVIRFLNLVAKGYTLLSDVFKAICAIAEIMPGNKKVKAKLDPSKHSLLTSPFALPVIQSTGLDKILGLRISSKLVWFVEQNRDRADLYNTVICFSYDTKSSLLDVRKDVPKISKKLREMVQTVDRCGPNKVQKIHEILFFLDSSWKQHFHNTVSIEYPELSVDIQWVPSGYHKAKKDVITLCEINSVDDIEHIVHRVFNDRKVKEQLVHEVTSIEDIALNIINDAKRSKAKAEARAKAKDEAKDKAKAGKSKTAKAKDGNTKTAKTKSENTDERNLKLKFDPEFPLEAEIVFANKSVPVLKTDAAKVDPGHNSPAWLNILVLHLHHLLAQIAKNLPIEFKKYLVALCNFACREKLVLVGDFNFHAKHLISVAERCGCSVSFAADSNGLPVFTGYPGGAIDFMLCGDPDVTARVTMVEIPFTPYKLQFSEPKENTLKKTMIGLKSGETDHSIIRIELMCHGDKIIVYLCPGLFEKRSVFPSLFGHREKPPSVDTEVIPEEFDEAFIKTFGPYAEALPKKARKRVANLEMLKAQLRRMLTLCQREELPSFAVTTELPLYFSEEDGTINWSEFDRLVDTISESMRGIKKIEFRKPLRGCNGSTGMSLNTDILFRLFTTKPERTGPSAASLGSTTGSSAASPGSTHHFSNRPMVKMKSRIKSKSTLYLTIPKNASGKTLHWQHRKSPTQNSDDSDDSDDALWSLDDPWGKVPVDLLDEEELTAPVKLCTQHVSEEQHVQRPVPQAVQRPVPQEVQGPDPKPVLRTSTKKWKTTGSVVESSGIQPLKINKADIKSLPRVLDPDGYIVTVNYDDKMYLVNLKYGTVIQTKGPARIKVTQVVDMVSEQNIEEFHDLVKYLSNKKPKEYNRRTEIIPTWKSQDGQTDAIKAVGGRSFASQFISYVDRSKVMHWDHLKGLDSFNKTVTGETVSRFTWQLYLGTLKTREPGRTPLPTPSILDTWSGPTSSDPQAQKREEMVNSVNSTIKWLTRKRFEFSFLLGSTSLGNKKTTLEWVDRKALWGNLKLLCEVSSIASSQDLEAYINALKTVIQFLDELPECLRNKFEVPAWINKVINHPKKLIGTNLDIRVDRLLWRMEKVHVDGGCDFIQIHDDNARRGGAQMRRQLDRNSPSPKPDEDQGPIVELTKSTKEERAYILADDKRLRINIPNHARYQSCEEKIRDKFNVPEDMSTDNWITTTANHDTVVAIKNYLDRVDEEIRQKEEKQARADKALQEMKLARLKTLVTARATRNKPNEEKVRNRFNVPENISTRDWILHLPNFEVDYETVMAISNYLDMLDE